MNTFARPTFSIVVALIVVAGVAAAIVWFAADRTPSSDADAKPSVVASFYPLAFFASEVGGDWVTVINLTPAGSEPHAFEPRPKDVTTVSQAALIMVNGAGFDGWLEDLAAENAPSATLVRAAEGVDLLPGAARQEPDPHLWLDPVRAQSVVNAISEALSAVDPNHANDYQVNAETLNDSLAELDNRFRTGLASCQRSTIVTSHDAFTYFADRYGLTVRSITGISPEDEPGPQALADLITAVGEEGVTTVFFETTVSPALAETVAREAGATTALLHTLESLTVEELARGDNYRTIMERNFIALRSALDCQ